MALRSSRSVPAVSSPGRIRSFAPHERRIYRLVLVVGSGVSEGEYVNQAFGLNNLVGATISNIATAAVRLVPDPVFDCSDVIGKVFDDRNANGYQDEGEPGIPNVRLATLNGVLVTSDADGRYHVACAAIANEYRGSNFVMKLDTRTLPAGYRVTTENPRDVRLTRGKVTKLNFGATIHRVVRLEVSDAAFMSGSTDLKPEWQARVTELPNLLRDKPSVVRIAYAVGGGGAEARQTTHAGADPADRKDVAGLAATRTRSRSKKNRRRRHEHAHPGVRHGRLHRHDAARCRTCHSERCPGQDGRRQLVARCSRSRPTPKRRHRSATSFCRRAVLVRDLEAMRRSAATLPTIAGRPARHLVRVGRGRAVRVRPFVPAAFGTGKARLHRGERARPSRFCGFSSWDTRMRSA